MHRLFSLVALLLLLSFIACTPNKQADEAIKSAQSLLATRPDSALSILDSIRVDRTAWPEAQRMRYDLVYAQAQNKAFVPFTTDSIVLAVAEYYDRHGSANERMMARYMVGCAYRDLGDAPTALKHYRLAVEAADTTARDCDLPTLMRIHSQTELLFESVVAFENAVEEAHRGEQLAWQIGDTLSALQLKCGRACTLYDARHFEEALALLDSTESFCIAHHINIDPGIFYPLRIQYRINIGDVKGSGKLLRQFEQKLFKPSNRQRIPDFVFYRLKGHYFNMVEQPDSAIAIFRLLLDNPVYSPTIDLEQLEFKEDYYRGLQNAYALKHEADSAVKYARLYCEYNDSVTQVHSSENLLRMQSLYNYSKAQEDALVAEQKASHMRFMLFSFGICGLAAGFGLWRFYRRRIKRERQKQIEQNTEYQRLRQQFEQSTHELQLYKSDAAQYRKEKEAENQKLRKALSLYQADNVDIEDWDEERNILRCEVAEHLHALATKGKEATQKEFDSLLMIAQSGFPHFFSTITDEAAGLSDKEITVCTLIRFRFIATEIAILTGLSPQRITNIKSSVNKKLFHSQGAKTLERKLIAIK